MVRFLVLLLVGAFSTWVFADVNDEACSLHHCLAVVDAGSTGSRLHVYAYEMDSSNSPINIQELYSIKTNPGLATLDASAPTIDGYLTGLLKNQYSQPIPLYFYATAGMRLLPKPKQDQLYQAVTQWFSHHAEWQLLEAKTITGKDEGIYGWLAVADGADNLSSMAPPDVGVMDMGGASVQVTFPLQNADEISESDKVSLMFHGQPITLFVHSFLGLGQTEVLHQFMSDAACFTRQYPLPDGSYAVGDANACEQDIALLMNSVHRVSSRIKPALQSTTISTWYALGGLAALVDTSPFQFSNHEFTLGALLAQGDSDTCQVNWSKFSSDYPNNDYLFGDCLFSAYYYALIVDGYGLASSTPIQYAFNDQRSDWTRGVVIRQAE